MSVSGRLALIVASLLGLGLAPAVQAAPPAGNSEATWLRKPSAEDMQAMWPAELKGSGEAKIHCRVTEAGLTERCVVLSETPAGKGVGASALLLTPNFVLRPRMVDGRPQAGEFSTTIRFNAMGGTPDGDRIFSLVHPIWLKAPTLAEVAAVMPKGQSAGGHVAMRCKVAAATGNLQACRVLTESPALKGFGSAAVRLAPRFQAVTTDDPRKAGNMQVTVPVTFEAPGDGPRYLSGFDWRVRPNPTQAAAIFPDKAAKDGIVTGRAIVDCLVQADGALADCGVVSEEPVDEGFGAAALRLATIMRAAPWTQDGRPIDGARVRMPFRVNLHDGEPAAKQP